MACDTYTMHTHIILLPGIYTCNTFFIIAPNNLKKAKCIYIYIYCFSYNNKIQKINECNNKYFK